MNRYATLYGLLKDIGITNRDDRHAFVSKALDREIISFKELTDNEIEALELYIRKESGDSPEALLTYATRHI